MRLAFSVAAHLEPEILLVDEVLAVGDAEFQKKCLGRMEELSGTGRTVLFVSHSMPSVLRLCPRVILLDGGHLTADGTGSQRRRGVHGAGRRWRSEREWSDLGTAPGDDRVRLRSVRVVNDDGVPVTDVDIRSAVCIEVEYWRLSDDPEFVPLVNLHFSNGEGTKLFSSQSNHVSPSDDMTLPGIMRSRCRIPGNFLAEGIVTVMAILSTLRPFEHVAIERDAVAFHVTDTSTGDGVRGEWPGPWPGAVRPMLEWEIGRMSGLREEMPSQLSALR